MNIFLSIFAGKCRICGQKTKWFAKEHVECKENLNKQQFEICTLIFDCVINNKGEKEDVKAQVESLFEKYNISDFYLDATYTGIFDYIVNTLIENERWTEEAEDRLFYFMYQGDFDILLLSDLLSYDKAIKASFMRELNEGIIQEKTPVDVTINLQKNEVVAWEFFLVNFYEQTTSTHYTGGHAGIGVKVAKGLYFRTGAFKGKPVQTTEMKFIANGNCILTNKHIYFQSSIRSLRIPYSKIISMDPYTDGLGIHLDGASSKPILFKDIDGWFAFNAISLLSKM